MKRLSFKQDVLPHSVAILVFLLVTISFFNPIFFENRILNQNDITQFLWGSKELRDFREATGEEGLWATTMFSGMPAYLVNMDWSDGVVVGMKKILSLFLPHPICNIFLSFVCYYILLLSFRIRPYVAVAGALAFGMSSYMIIGLGAGHNARIGAIAFMPLVMAGIHLAFSGKRILGSGVTAAGLALHLRENHVQITYYLLMVVIGYGIVQLVLAAREKQLPEFAKTLGALTPAAMVAAGTFFGPLWAITEYSKYSTRAPSELKSSSINTIGTGLPKSYAFQYNNGITEPITALIPNFYGGSSSHAFVNEENSKTYQALVRSGDQNIANQLAQYTSSYWGDQPLSAPYYAGAIMVFLFVLGCLIAERKWVWWLLPVTAIAIMLSWGSNFASFNYFVFDHLPGYNKFRSVTFVMVVVFFSMPLLGLIGLEKILKDGLTKDAKRKLLVAFGLTGGLCFIFFVFPGMMSYARSVERELPAWFANALHEDRKAMLRDDALRSFAFIASIFVLLYFDVPRKVSGTGFFVFLAFMTLIDVTLVDRRYFTKDNYQRKRDNSRFTPWASDEAILKDKSYYRVYNLLDFYEAGTSQFHHSLGGYNGVRLKRYQELIDSCILPESERLIDGLRAGKTDFSQFGVLNMLNAKYFVYGQEASNVIPNPSANGVAWFVKGVNVVNSANEELAGTSRTNTKEIAIVDGSKFKVSSTSFQRDSMAVIRLADQKPYWQKFEIETSTQGLAVFSEIYYPKGWTATLDGKEVPILRADFVLRALEIPPGKHVVEFLFQPRPYLVGDKVTMASSWVLLIGVIASLAWSWRKEN